MVGHVFDDFHLGMNGLKALSGLLVSFEPAKGHFEHSSSSYCASQIYIEVKDLNPFRKLGNLMNFDIKFYQIAIDTFVAGGVGFLQHMDGI